MSRDWFLRNKNGGNVLKTNAQIIDFGSASAATKSVTPNGNLCVISLINIVGASTLNINGARSMKGDQMLVHQKGAGASSIVLSGDATAKTYTTVDGVYWLTFNGTKWDQNVIPT